MILTLFPSKFKWRSWDMNRKSRRQKLPSRFSRKSKLVAKETAPKRNAYAPKSLQPRLLPTMATLHAPFSFYKHNVYKHNQPEILVFFKHNVVLLLVAISISFPGSGSKKGLFIKKN